MPRGKWVKMSVYLHVGTHTHVARLAADLDETVPRTIHMLLEEALVARGRDIAVSKPNGPGKRSKNNVATSTRAVRQRTYG
jgi:hypothetical protein